MNIIAHRGRNIHSLLISLFSGSEYNSYIFVIHLYTKNQQPSAFLSAGKGLPYYIYDISLVIQAKRMELVPEHRRNIAILYQHAVR